MAARGASDGYREGVTTKAQWIAAVGLWPVRDDPSEAVIPDHVFADPDLSLLAKGLFAVLIAEQGKPVNPYEDAHEDASDIAAAIDELVDAELAVRLAAP